MEFLDLRDEFGITQIVISTEKSKNFTHTLANITTECVLQVVGNVVERSNKNEKISTGEIEIDA
jgi:aspartyl-tRNA synthetase